MSSGTGAIVLESACFLPASVRRTSKRLGLKTEASARFERGSDIGATVPALERAAALLEQTGAGRVRGGLVDCYPSPAPPRTLTLRAERIARILGLAVPAPDIIRILTGLGFVARDAAPHGVWSVSVPTFRVDVTREIDLVEEVGRHYGYDRLPSTFPPLETPPEPADRRIERDRIARRVLLAAGCSEAVTFSFIGADAAEPFATAADIVPISNPLTAQFAVLRPSLVPGLLAALVHNRHRQIADVRLFEIGAVVTRAGLRQQAAVAWTGAAGPPHWNRPGRAVDFFDVKGVVERLADALGVELSFQAAGAAVYLVRGRAAMISVDGRPAGQVGLLARDEDVYVAELDLDQIEAARTRASRPLRFAPLPRYPSIARDISIIVDQVLPAESVRGTIRSAAPPTLVSVAEFDRYQGKGVPEQRVSLSFRLTFRSPERTLTDAEVDAAMKQILAALEHAHAAVQR